MDEIKRGELEKALGRLAHLSPQDRNLVEGMASSIVNKLIHSTMVTLKSEVNSDSGAAFVEAARRFFNLDQPSGSSDTVEQEAIDPSRYLTPLAPSEQDPSDAETVLRRRKE